MQAGKKTENIKVSWTEKQDARVLGQVQLIHYILFV